MTVQFAGDPKQYIAGTTECDAAIERILSEGLPDSGARRTFDTGSVRDKAVGKGRYDLISPIALERLAKRLEAGALKYDERNWEKGQPLSVYVDSGIRHFFKYLAGYKDEDHLAAAAWNAFAAMHTEVLCAPDSGHLPEELNDLPDYT